MAPRPEAYAVVGRALLPLLQEIDFSRLEDAHAAQLRKLCVERVETVATEDEVRRVGGRRELARLGGDLGAVLVSCRALFGLMQAAEVNEILINGPHRVTCEVNGQRAESDFSFGSVEPLLQVARWLAAGMGSPVTPERPDAEGQLTDGSRVSNLMPPAAVDGPVISIRRSALRCPTLEDLAGLGTMPPALVALLDASVRAGLGILVSGAPGVGRTALLGALAAAVPVTTRMATVERTAELQLRRPDVLRLEAGPATSAEQLVRTAARMRPDRLVVDDLRGAEGWELVQAMNSGTSGCLAAIEAASARDALERLEALAGSADSGVGDRTLRRQIGRAFDLVVHLRRLSDGRRVLGSICEISPGDPPQLEEVFRFHDHGAGPDGRSVGTFAATGVRPALVDRLERLGVHVPPTVWTLQEAVA